MSPEHLSLSKSSLAYAKLAATPTETAWSQVYNAGNLFACLSVTVSPDTEDKPSLQALGKELFNNLEAEFFTLEEKNLTTIAEAIEKSIKHVPVGVSVNFCLAYFKESVLYLFLLGRGRVIMKRGEKLGILLERKTDTEQALQTASGFLENSDTIILETNQFAKNVSDKHLTEALQLELPNDIAETLSLHMHKHADGDQAAIIIVNHGITQPHVLVKDATLEEELEDERELPAPVQTPRKPFILPSFTKIFEKLPHISLPFTSQKRHIVMGRLPHRKKIFASVAVILLCLFVASIVFTKQKQESSRTTALFESIYTPALKSYDEGKSLAGLNEELSREDLQKAEKILQDGQNKFPKDSKEGQQIAELLAKVQKELGPQTDTTSSLKEASVGETALLKIEKANTDARGISQDDKNIYFVTDSAIFSVAKTNGKKTELIKNDGDWQKAVAIVPYQANLYLLDQKDGVVKFIGSSDGFSKSSYFKSSSPDLTKALSMAIDSSIWILFHDGTIKKFTKGEADSFTIKGLTAPFKSPTKIYTDKDINNVYILDNGNSRIVKLSTDGSFQAEYKASEIKQARDFEVLEKDKKILILSNDKVWEIAL